MTHFTAGLAPGSGWVLGGTSSNGKGGRPSTPKRRVTTSPNCVTGYLTTGTARSLAT